MALKYDLQLESNFQRKVLNWLKQNGVYAIKYNASGI